MSTPAVEEPGAAPPLILVTNDDGVHEPGIKALAEALAPLGEVVVIGPDRNCSGVSHKISLLHPLRGIQLRDGWWQVDGSPADCVYLGVHQLLPRRPALVVSGINAGPNLSFDVHYSGTVGAAFEGTLLGVPSIAVSLTDPRGGSYALAAEFTAKVARWVLQGGLPTNTTLNINVPGGSPKRYQLTFLGHRLFRHSVDRRDDPRGAPYYWIGGVPSDPEDIPGSDCNAVAAGVISVTPLTVDMTHVRALTRHLADLQLPGAERVGTTQPPEELELLPPR
jgi:5'-nucleotidase